MNEFLCFNHSGWRPDDEDTNASVRPSNNCWLHQWLSSWLTDLLCFCRLWRPGQRRVWPGKRTLPSAAVRRGDGTVQCCSAAVTWLVFLFFAFQCRYRCLIGAAVYYRHSHNASSNLLIHDFWRASCITCKKMHENRTAMYFLHQCAKNVRSLMTKKS